MKSRTSSSILYITYAAIIAALYTALTLFAAPYSFGLVQVRISEALTVLPALTPAGIPGVTIGCLISNLISGNIWDVLFGTLATLIGAIFTHIIGKKFKLLSPIPPIVANTLIIPWILKYTYVDCAEESITLMMCTICAGEVISCGVLGLILLYAIKDRRIFKEF